MFVSIVSGFRNYGMNFTRKLMNREGFLGLFIASVGGLGTLIVGIPIIWTWCWPADQSAAQSLARCRRRQQLQDRRDRAGEVQVRPGRAAAVVRSHPGDRCLAAPRQLHTSFTAFAVYCTHLGCPVHWLAAPKIFLCPCHGSVFNGDGTVAGGPAPRALFQYPVRVRERPGLQSRPSRSRSSPRSSA